jgi:hypothetical protein
MVPSFAILIFILIVVPGLLIPFLIMVRMFRVAFDVSPGRSRADKIFARFAIFAMLGLMALALYGAQEMYRLLNALAMQ